MSDAARECPYVGKGPCFCDTKWSPTDHAFKAGRISPDECGEKGRLEHNGPRIETRLCGYRTDEEVDELLTMSLEVARS